MARLYLDRRGSIREHGEHVAWLIPEIGSRGDLIIALSPWRTDAGEWGNSWFVFPDYPHYRLWRSPLRWTGHLDEDLLRRHLGELEQLAGEWGQYKAGTGAGGSRSQPRARPQPRPHFRAARV